MQNAATRLIAVLMGLFVLSQLVGIGTDLTRVGLLQDWYGRYNLVGARIPDDAIVGSYNGYQLRDALMTNESQHHSITLSSWVIYAAIIAVFCRWIYVASCNARAMGAVGMRFTPGWSVAWYFVPVANLWKPFQVMCEIWNASANPAQWRGEVANPLLVFWRLSFLAMNVIARVSDFEFRSAHNIDDIWKATILHIISSTVSAVSAFLTLTVVGRLTRMQGAGSMFSPSYAPRPS
jgi:hypothetical protein